MEEVEMLKAAGLFENDIELYFDSLKGEQFLSTKHKNWEGSLLKQKLYDINFMVTKHKEQLSNLM